MHVRIHTHTHTRAAHASVDWQVESLGGCDGQNSYLCFKERHDHDWEWLLWDQYKGLLWLCTFYMSFFVLLNHLSDRNMSLPWDFTQRHHVIYKKKLYIYRERVHHGLIIQGYVSQLTEDIPQVCVAILHKQTIPFWMSVLSEPWMVLQDFHWHWFMFLSASDLRDCLGNNRSKENNGSIWWNYIFPPFFFHWLIACVFWQTRQSACLRFTQERE